jgi:hypothetical protein
MIINITQEQIPMAWEHIKHSCFAGLESQPLTLEIQEQMNDLLYSLLSGRSQAWVSMDEERRVLSIMVTQVLGDHLTGSKALHLQHFHSFSDMDSVVSKTYVSILQDFAFSQGCVGITAKTGDQRMQEVLGWFGFEEVQRIYTLPLEGN